LTDKWKVTTVTWELMNDYVLNVLELTLFNNGITVESHYLGDGQ